MDLGGKGTLVTGANKGIGKAIAEEFTKEGALVSICARGQQNLARAAEALCRYGAPVVATSADVTRAEEVQHVIDATLKSCGRIDIWLCYPRNAGRQGLFRNILNNRGVLTTRTRQSITCITLPASKPSASMRGPLPKRGGIHYVAYNAAWIGDGNR